MATEQAARAAGEIAKTGAVAGLVGATVQVLVGLLLDRLLLPPGQHNNIAPRLIKRLAQKQGLPANPVRDWVFGTLFHFGYGVAWGYIYALARRWSAVPGLLLGGGMGLVIYLLAFSRVGAGTRSQTESDPRHRQWQKQLSLVGVAWTFALSTAVVYDRLVQRARARWEQTTG